MNNARHLKQTLLNLIDKLSHDHRDFLFNPDKDFTKNRKLIFHILIKFTLCMEAGSIKDALYHFFGLDMNIPSASAVVHQRWNIKFEVFQWLFESFNSKTYKSQNHLYKGYRWLAVDSCSVTIKTDTDDKTHFINQKNSNGYIAYHLNASYDLMEHTYNNVIIQDAASKNENDTFRQLVDRYNGMQAIFISDRESYNNFEHVAHSGNKYLTRVRDITFRQCMTQSLGPYPEQYEFDVDVFRKLTLKQTKKSKPAHSSLDYCQTNHNLIIWTKIIHIMNSAVGLFKITDDTYMEIRYKNASHDIKWKQPTFVSCFWAFQKIYSIISKP